MKVYLFTVTNFCEEEVYYRLFRRLEDAKEYLRKAVAEEVREEIVLDHPVRHHISEDGMYAEVDITDIVGNTITVCYDISEQEVIE